MKNCTKVVVTILLLSVTAQGCGDDRAQGDFSVLTYNVAGLPVPLSWEHPAHFVDAEGHDLADHKLVAVRFHWEETQ